MPIAAQDYDRVTVLKLGGDLTGPAADELRRAADDAARARVAVGSGCNLVVDLDGCGGVDSAGLEALLWTKRRCELAGGWVKLVGAGEVLRKVLEITRLDFRFEVCGDLAGAMRNVR